MNSHKMTMKAKTKNWEMKKVPVVIARSKYTKKAATTKWIPSYAARLKRHFVLMVLLLTAATLVMMATMNSWTMSRCSPLTSNWRRSSDCAIARKRARVSTRPTFLYEDLTCFRSDVDAQREATHFKNRVLDLVDTFLKKKSTSPLIVQLLLPLVELSTVTGSDERHLADKAKGIPRSRIAKSKDVPSDTDIEGVKTAMSELHSRARKLHSPE